MSAANINCNISADQIRTGRPGMLLDYHECESVDALVCILNDVVQSGFLLEKIIPQPYGCFVVLFRRHDIG